MAEKRLRSSEKRYLRSTFLKEEEIVELLDRKYPINNDNKRKRLYHLCNQMNTAKNICIRIRTNYCYNKYMGIYCYDEGISIECRNDGEYSKIKDGKRFISFVIREVNKRVDEEQYFSLRLFYEVLEEQINRIYWIKSSNSVYLDVKQFIPYWGRQFGETTRVEQVYTDYHKEWCEDHIKDMGRIEAQEDI